MFEIGIYCFINIICGSIFYHLDKMIFYSMILFNIILLLIILTQFNEIYYIKQFFIHRYGFLMYIEINYILLVVTYNLYTDLILIIMALPLYICGFILLPITLYDEYNKSIKTE